MTKKSTAPKTQLKLRRAVKEDAIAPASQADWAGGRGQKRIRSWLAWCFLEPHDRNSQVPCQGPLRGLAPRTSDRKF